MNIIKRYTTKNQAYIKNLNRVDSRYTNFQDRGAKGLVLHSVGAPQPKAEVFANYFNNSNIEASVHAVLQPDGTVYQLAPWNYRMWHVGGNANNTHIGVEMTEPSCIYYDAKNGYKLTIKDKAQALEFVRGTYKVAVELFAFLCKELKLNPLEDGVILSHSECYKRGIGSNHGDTEHLWNAVNSGYTMDTFRKAVATKMEEDKQMEKRFMTFEELPEWAKPEAKELIEAGALRGNDKGLDITEDMLRIMIICKRYSDGRGNK